MKLKTPDITLCAKSYLKEEKHLHHKQSAIYMKM